MRVSVVACSGRKLASLDAQPSWQLRDILAGVVTQKEGGPFRRRLFLREAELRGRATLADVGATDGSILTLVLAPPWLLATASEDDTIGLWSASSGERLCKMDLDMERGYCSQGLFPSCVAFSPDGQKVLSASNDKTAQIWAADGGKCLYFLEDHDEAVFSAVFSPDGEEVLTASKDGTVKIWSAASEEQPGDEFYADDRNNSGERSCLRTLRGHSSAVFSAVFSPSGKEVLSASDDRTAKLWCAASGKCLSTLQGHQDSVCSAVFSPDGQRVLTASLDGTAKLWSVENGLCLRTLRGHQGARLRPNSLQDQFGDEVAVPFASVFSPDGQIVMTASWDWMARLWCAESGDCKHTLEGHQGEVLSAVFSPDGQEALTASRDLTARLWAVQSGVCLRVLKGHEDEVVCAVFSPDGQEVLTGSRDRTARLWGAKSGECLRTLEGHRETIWSAVFSP